jgi:hypothetical protein
MRGQDWGGLSRPTWRRRAIKRAGNGASLWRMEARTPANPHLAASDLRAHRRCVLQKMGTISTGT